MEYTVRDTQFGKDFDKPMNINGRQSTKGKPHRHYTLKGVKAYFGLEKMGYDKHGLLECLEGFKTQLEKYNS